jgi:predicted GIY-YIG superfamily endonuclease
MSPEFYAVVESMHENYERLIRADRYTKGMLLPLKGVYLFREDGRDLYVGRSNNIRERYRDHMRGGVNQTAFARLLAREKLGLKRTYTPGARERASNPEFVEAFRKARKASGRWSSGRSKSWTRLGRRCWKSIVPLHLKRPTMIFVPISPRQQS